MGTDNLGLAGVEYAVRRPALRRAGRAAGRQRPPRQQVGYHILAGRRAGQVAQLTIDEDIQFEAEKVLADVVEQFEAKKACAVVIEPSTGEILAMANTPVFDTNPYGSVEEKDRRNSVVIDHVRAGIDLQDGDRRRGAARRGW